MKRIALAALSRLAPAASGVLHPGADGQGPFMPGLSRPRLGLDPILAMVAVGFFGVATAVAGLAMATGRSR